MTAITKLSLLGYNEEEKEAIEQILSQFAGSGTKFAVLLYGDDGFQVRMHNLNKQEQKEIIDEVTREYNLAVNA